MTRVDFYLLTEISEMGRQHYACRLIEKAYHHQHRVYVYCDDKAQAHSIDELLWTFRDDSFVPHNIQGEGPNAPPAVQVGFNPPQGFNDILVNLSQRSEDFFAKFKRVIELVPNEDNAKNLAREHYKYYRAHGFELHSHDLTKTTTTQ
ncbi:MAG: DNA polymerase III subunit chi [Legionellales bacterium]|nr:DNA polymerase III subunit chi [Legionellales bacterium]|tara:strand:+ start:19091 stop:19534 length:444 start_codon:yes stop_codon:yes gene_type:complete